MKPIFNNDFAKLQGIICVVGNDGTGKSSLVKSINNQGKYFAIERGSPDIPEGLQKIIHKIKELDTLTYAYFFEQSRNNFKLIEEISFLIPKKNQDLMQIKNDDENKNIQITLPVYWFMLTLSTEETYKRIKDRLVMTKYQSKKCLEYYHYVYLELAFFYGIPVFSSKASIIELTQMINIHINSKAYFQIHSSQMRSFDAQKLHQLNIQKILGKKLQNDEAAQIYRKCILPSLRDQQKQFYYPKLIQLQNPSIMKAMALKWILLNSKHQQQQRKEPQLDAKTKKICIRHSFIYSIDNKQKTIQCISPSPYIQLFQQGQSKQLYNIRSLVPQVEKYFSSKLIIVLKSTIYSHTQQHTGYIKDLALIRATGSNLFLQMLKRSNIQHAYYCVNAFGIILSEKIKPNDTQLIWKTQWIGTDKHSYINLNTQQKQSSQTIVHQNGKYTSGIYVRIDWRNANHILLKYPSYILNQGLYYYSIEQALGKNTFFTQFLQCKNSQKLKAMGDKCITADLLQQRQIISAKTKQFVVKLYCVFEYYAKKVGLQIIDGCVMIDSKGSIVWSELNPDCLRVKSIASLQNQRINYDKDIWRTGGSSANISQKWILFNQTFKDYFLKNKFHLTEMIKMPPLSYTYHQTAAQLLNNNHLTKQYKAILKKLSKPQNIRDVICTMDLADGIPKLVRTGIITQSHSISIDAAYDYIRLMPKIVIVDLDAALKKPQKQENFEESKVAPNYQPIKQLLTHQNIYAIGGGIRNKVVLDYYLNTLKVNKIIIGSNWHLIKQLSQQTISEKVIIQLTVNEKNNVLTYGRSNDTEQNVIKAMMHLTQLGVRTFSITFHQKEGHLNSISHAQLQQIMWQVPGKVRNVIIAGGITSFDDLQFIWGFEKCIPQLGSAIWKKNIPLPQLFCSLVHFDSSQLVPAIITDQDKTLLGEVFMNEESLKLTLETKYLHRYSRKLQRCLIKGQESGNKQEVINIFFDCDHDCLNIVVKGENIFCHLNTKTCFNSRNINEKKQRNKLQELQQHIKQKMVSGSGYSRRMQTNPDLALTKVKEQLFELSVTKDRIVQESADLLAHLIMFWNGKGVSVREIIGELQNRTKAVHKNQSQKPLIDNNCMGLVIGKHTQMIYDVVENLLGIKINYKNNRNMKIQYQITNTAKYQRYFSSKITIIGIKPKDLASLLVKGIINSCLNYSILMQNAGNISKEIDSVPVQNLKLVLLKKKERNINPHQWTKQLKGVIVSQYPRSVSGYFNKIGIDQTHYTIIEVRGSTEGYLENAKISFCDAIFYTGKTVAENQLQIVTVLEENIRVGYYVSL